MAQMITKPTTAIAASPARPGTAVTIAMPVTITTPMQQQTAGQTTVTVVGTSVSSLATPTVSLSHSVTHTAAPPNVTITQAAVIPSAAAATVTQVSAATAAGASRPVQTPVIVSEQQGTQQSPVKQVQVTVPPSQTSKPETVISVTSEAGTPGQATQQQGGDAAAQQSKTPYAMRLRNPPRNT
ncbi:uncharacterized protein LOC106160892 [Lingula anatina]|uniref:Uncharacterized protein LOC106160892 n=1 Tax=Lingula anatina TaxID=7574 RepID=A0A1S3I4C7_LINAN|nr:uncharacterized protein LOC106160892 [Lingula anatina]|eukprot:XP_013393117.1 uncharacterized protein LOC106160892 [Lingula anatina]